MCINDGSLALPLGMISGKNGKAF